MVDTIFGILLGIGSIIAGSFRWLSKRFRDVEERMDAIEKDAMARNQLTTLSIVKLETYHDANQKRLDGIEDSTERINEKLDRLIEGMVARRCE